MKISTTTGLMAVMTGSDAEALRRLAAAGFDACDFSMWNYPLEGGIWDAPEDEFDRYFSELRSAAEEAGIAVGQTHAPFPSSVGVEAEDARRLRCIRRAVRATALLGSGYVVVHPPMHAVETGGTAAFAQGLEQTVDFYRGFIPLLEETGVRIAVENMFRRDPETKELAPTFFSTAADMLGVLDALDDTHFCACLDIGHSLVCGESPASMVMKLGRRLKVLHVQDNSGRQDQHLIPGLGKADWNGIAAALRDIRYPGTFSLEADGFARLLPEGTQEAALPLMADVARKVAAKAEWRDA